MEPPQNIPIPDPSLLTTEHLRREVHGLRELLESRLASVDEQFKHMRELSAERMLSRTQQFAAMDTRFQQRFENADRAVSKAEFASEKRFESVNEFRATLSDQAASLMTRSEGEAKINALSDRIQDLKGRVDVGDGGKAASTASFTSILAVSGLVISLVTVAFVGIGLFTRLTPPATVATPALVTPAVPPVIYPRPEYYRPDITIQPGYAPAPSSNRP